MVLVGLGLAFVFGLFHLPWWTALIAAAITIVGAAMVDFSRTEKAIGGGNPILLFWAALPCMLLWWIGSLF